MTQSLRIGLIGAGRFGRLHLKVLQQLAGVEVAALADVSSEALAAAAEEANIGVEACYTDPLALIELDDLDAVDIVSDESSHGPLALAALRSGKHVIVEKPLAVTLQEAKAIQAASEKAGLQVLVGNISRFSQPYFTIKRNLDEGLLGRVAAIRTKRNFSRDWFHSFGSRVHPVYESGVHELDLLVWYAGARCKSVAAFERYMSGHAFPDLFAATLQFENGVVASLDSSWLVPPGGPRNLVDTLELDGTIDAQIEVIGERGTAQYRLSHAGLSIWTAERVLQPEVTLWPTGPDGSVGGAIAAELAHFIRVIAENRPSPIMPLTDSLHVMEIADAIVTSAREGRMVTLAHEGESE